MKLYVYLFFLVITVLSCKRNENIVTQKIPKDTINIPKNNRIEKKCLEKIKGFKNKYGIVISNYYREETLSIDFDNNKTIDTIAVLKPFYENNIDGCYSSNSESDLPFLIISKTINKKSKIFRIYKNALAINGANYYEEINIKRNGFIISKDYNGNNGFFSKTYISFKKNDFYVDSIKVESWGLNQYSKTFHYKDKIFALSKYKRTDIDSIRNILDLQK